MKTTNARINKLLAGFLLFTLEQEEQKPIPEFLPAYLDDIEPVITSQEKEHFRKAIIAWSQDNKDNNGWTNLGTELGAFAVLFKNI